MIPDKALARQGAWIAQILPDVGAAVARGVPADQHLAAFYRAHHEFGSRDRRLFSGVAFAWFRWRGWLDALPQPDPATAGALAHALDSDEVMQPAVLALARTTKLPVEALRPLGAETLEARAVALAAWTGIPRPVWRDLLPSWIWAHLPPPAGGDADTHHQRLADAFQHRVPTWLRVRPGASEALRDAFAEAGLAVTPHPGMASAWALPAGAGLRALAARFPNAFDIQDIASQVVGLICAPQPGAHWWDACAGGGGKTLHLADLMAGRGTLLATDLRRSALEELERRAQSPRGRWLQTARWDGRSETAPRRAFDGVLLDAPCSGIGTWHRNPDARWRLAEDELQRKPELQRQLLLAAAEHVQPGGRLVYATCTLTGAENTRVVEDFRQQRADFTLDPFENPLDGQPTDGAVWIYPWASGGNGMFIARLRRA